MLLRKRESKFISPSCYLKWPWTYPITKNFYLHHFEGCKYSSFSGTRRSLMGNYIQQSCSILLHQIILNDVFFVSCLDSQLFSGLHSTMAYITWMCLKQGQFFVKYIICNQNWIKANLRLNAASRLMMITILIMLKLNVKKDQRDKKWHIGFW